MVEPTPTDPAAAPLLGLLRRTHLSSAGALPRLVAEEAAVLGARNVHLHLIDYEQEMLVALDPDVDPMSVTGTIAGRAYSTTTLLTAPDESGTGERLWIPLLDGTDRVGVLGMTFAAAPDRDLLAVCERYGHLVALLAVAKNAYTDLFEIARRRKRMTIASELVQSVAPPLLFATDGITIAGMLEPAYDNGGDALDYAVNDDILHFAVFDAMGHGLAAAGVAAFAISAYRHSRRSGLDLVETYGAMDEAVGRQFPDARFVTALIAQLERDTGRLRWVSAGHPPPLLVRGGRHARLLETVPAPPLGVLVDQRQPPVAEASLEPGDQILLYTDGLTEARSPDGGMLSAERLGEFLEREAGAGQPAPETLRRLRLAVMADGETDLRDDATALLVQWRRDTEITLMPQTVARG